MLRLMLLILPLLVLFGCGEPLTPTDTSDGGSSGPAAETTASKPNEASTKDEVRGLLDQFKVALEKRDWEGLHKLHWSGMQQTPQSLQELYESKLEKLGGVGAIPEIDFQPLNAQTYQQYMDEEELPGPLQLLTGSVEFEVPGDTQRTILVWAYTCKEDDTPKIFGYIEVSLE